MRSDLLDYFGERWRGKVALSRLFWFDMLLMATALNMLFVFISLVMLAKRVEWPWVIAVQTVILPYNAFLVSAVWRHAKTKAWMRAASASWLLVLIAV